MRTRPPVSESGFASLGLASPLLATLAREGYEIPTPIQAEGIPAVLAGRDVLGAAQTGTGKTAAFALPILHRLHSLPAGALRALVLTPTRELAVQVAESFRKYGKDMPHQCGTLLGGVDMWHQEALLRRGTDVLVATPGRLLDHIYRGNLNFGTLEVAVLDEADRMLDMGFIDDVKSIFQCLPTERQTLLFSATLEGEIQRLAKDLLRDPVWVKVSPSQATVAEGVRQVAHYVDEAAKRDILRHLIDTLRIEQAIVFVRTKDGADRVARHLENTGVRVGALHSNKSQSARLSILEGFKYGRIRVLVATDVAARGLDIPRVSHVINYDVPLVAEDYIHRIGRTARAGQTGDAITLVCSREQRLIDSIERLLGMEMPIEGIPGHTIRPPHGRTEGPGRPRPGSAPRGRSAVPPARRSEAPPRREEVPSSPRRSASGPPPAARRAPPRGDDGRGYDQADDYDAPPPARSPARSPAPTPQRASHAQPGWDSGPGQRSDFNEAHRRPTHREGASRRDPEVHPERDTGHQHPRPAPPPRPPSRQPSAAVDRGRGRTRSRH